MGHNADFINYIKEGLGIYGTHFGSSRNNSLRLAVYEDAESALATFVEAPASLIVSSGMWAGQLVMKMIEAFIPQSQIIKYHYAPRVHPALWGNAFVQSKADWKDWASATVRSIQQSPSEYTYIICTDAIGSPWVEEFDFSIFESLHEKQNTWFIVDDSHSLGVRGENGKGSYKILNDAVNAQIIVVSSLNKALGIPGGLIFGNTDILESLRSSPWFAGASPPPPAYIYALQSLLKNNSFVKAHAILKSNVVYLNEKITKKEIFHSISDYPVLCSRETRLYDHLLKNGIMASCFSYPSPTDSPVTRLAINALHQKKDLDRLAEVFIKF